MNLYIKVEGRNWAVQHAEIRSLLGCGYPNPELPDSGMPPQVVQGIVVWIEPKDRAKRTKAGQRFFHRTLAICPRCNKIMSVARMQQHAKIHVGETVELT